MTQHPDEESRFYAHNKDGSRREIRSDVPEPPLEAGGEIQWPDIPPAKLDDATRRLLDELISTDPNSNPAVWHERLLEAVRAVGKQCPPEDEYSAPSPWPSDESVAQVLAASLKTGLAIASKMAGMKWLCEFLAKLAVKASDQEFWLYENDIAQINRARAEVAKAQIQGAEFGDLDRINSFDLVSYVAHAVKDDPDQKQAAARVRAADFAMFGGDPPPLVEGRDYYIDKGKRPDDATPTEGGTEPNSSAPESPLEDLLTLDQIAATVSKSKRTLETYLKEVKLPRPDVSGGGGKAHYWKWSTVLPALRKHFRPDLPGMFPGSRIV